MPAHLLIAPPAAGKTRFCLERIRDALHTNPFASIWVLVSDQLQAGQFRARLREGGAVAPVRVATFGDLNAEILEQAGRSLPLASDAMLHRLLQEEVRRMASAGLLPYYSSIWEKPGFLLEMHQRIGELKRALVTPEALAAAARRRSDPGLIELAGIYAVYQSRLQELEWADVDGLAWLAHAALQADPTLMGQTALLAVDGFDNFNPAQIRILQALAGRAAETWITLPGDVNQARLAHRRFQRALQVLQAGLGVQVRTLENPPYLPPTLRQLEANLFESGVDPQAPQADLDWIEARSPAEECREALRWLKARCLRAGIPAAECAVAVPELEPYRASLKAAAAEFGLPLRFLHGPALSVTPAAAAVSDLLGLALNDYPLRPLLDTIRSPFFTLDFSGLKPPDAKLLEIASRYGQVVQGLDQWREVLEGLRSQAAELETPEAAEEDGLAAPRLPSGDTAGRLQAGLERLAQRLSPPGGQLPLMDWAAWLDDLLEELGFFDILLAAGETGLCHTFEDLFATLGRSEALTGPCPTDYPGFLKVFGGLLEATPVKNEDADTPAVLALPLIDLRGVRFQAVAVVGLAEGSFPAVEREDPFLRDDLRREIGMEPRLDQAQAGLFYQAVTRADCYLLLGRPYLAADGETWEASPYWNAVQETLQGGPARIRPEDTRPLSEAASPEELLFWAARRQAQLGLDLATGLQAGLFEKRWQYIRTAQAILAARLQKEARGAFDGGLEALEPELGQRFGPRAGWSASRLEAYATCPYFFLAAYALGLEVLEPPQLDYQANQLGSLLHEVLQAVYEPSLGRDDPEEVLERLPGVARRIFSEAPGRYQFRPSLLWEVQQEELLSVLEKTITGIAGLDEGSDWRPAAVECEFGLEGKPPLVISLESGEVRLHGVVDRVDVNADGQVRVIDYKSGGSHLATQDLLDGRRLQLPLYALAASRVLKLGLPVEGFYWKLFQAEASPLKLSRFVCEAGSGPLAAITVAEAAVEKIVGGIRAGSFEPRPPQGGCPSYCPAVDWCWHYQPERR